MGGIGAISPTPISPTPISPPHAKCDQNNVKFCRERISRMEVLVGLLQLDLGLLWGIILKAVAGKWLELDQSSPGLAASSSLTPYRLQSLLHLGDDCAHLICWI